MTKVLVSDPIDQIGIDILSQVAHVDVRTGLSQDELIGLIGDYDALMIRSGTQVTAAVIEAAPKLRIIGRAGVGVDNVDVRVGRRQRADRHSRAFGVGKFSGECGSGGAAQHSPNPICHADVSSARTRHFYNVF